MGGSVSNRKLLQYSISNISHAPSNNMYTLIYIYTYSNANANTNTTHGDGRANRSEIKRSKRSCCKANPAYNTYNITFPARTSMRPCLCRRATLLKCLCVCVHMFALYHRKRNYFRLMGYLFLLQFNLNGFEMAFGWAGESASRANQFLNQ